MTLDQRIERALRRRAKEVKATNALVNRVVLRDGRGEPQDPADLRACGLYEEGDECEDEGRLL